jgi:hypothetical protein
VNARVLDDRCAELLREAQEWRLLGLLFERPRAGWHAHVARLAAGLTDADLRSAAEEAVAAHEGAYLAVLGPGGAFSPREAGYRRTADPARLLAEIRAAYDAFAFAPEREDPFDHVAVEAGFVGWLKLKEAFAHASGDHAAAAITAAATRGFVERHVACLAEPLADRLATLAEGHLAPASRALLARAGPRPRDLEGDWVPQGFDDESCALACGAAGGCAPDEELDPFAPGV